VLKYNHARIAPSRMQKAIIMKMPKIG
jgi:hypothetical protein